MFRPILLALCATLPVTAALAQDATPPPDEQGGFAAPAGMSGDEGMGHEGHGMEMMMAHHPDVMGAMAAPKGFVLDLGQDRSLRVNCGDETMAECLEAMRPVIDQMPSLAGE